MKKYTEELMTAQELADRLKVSLETIRRWKNDGMPHIQLTPGAVRYQLSEVIEWRVDLTAKKLKERMGAGN